MVSYYRQLLIDSWKQAFKNKMLWFLGIFISGISFFATFDSNNDLMVRLIKNGEVGAMFSTVLNNIPGLMILIFLAFFIVMLSLVSLICKAGIIKGISLTREGKTSFGENFKFGIKKILPMLLLDVILLLPNYILFIIILVGVKLNFPSLVFIVLELVMFFYSIFIMLINHFAYCEICLENKNTKESLIFSLNLLVKNWKKILIVNIMRFFASVIFWLANVLVLLVTALPFILLAIISYVVGLLSLAMICVGLGIIVLLMALFVVKGLLTAFMYTMLTKLYWDIK
jgi:hypothetical protein